MERLAFGAMYAVYWPAEQMLKLGIMVDAGVLKSPVPGRF